MKNRVKLMALAMGVFIFFLASIVMAEDFSADMVSTTKEGTFEGKIFVSQDKVRMEIPESISITRMDKQVVWILMPVEKMYMEQPYDPSKVVATSEKISGEIERKLLGQETIDGRMTNKYQVVYKENGKTETMFQWLAPGLSIPLKTAAADNSWMMEYKNIKTEKQPDSLFEIPADYQKFSNQMPSMKDMLEQYGR
jgi:hypothetical protein